MAEWTVQTDQLNALAQRMEQCTRTLRNIQSDVDSVRGSLQFRLRSGVALDHKLQALCQQIEQEAGKNQQLLAVMQRAVQQYQSTERKLGGAESHTRVPKRVAPPVIVKNDTDGKKIPEAIKTLFKVCGPIGDAATIGADLYEGENGKAVGDSVKLLGKGIKAAKDGSGKWFENFFETGRKSKDILTQKADIKNAKDFLFGKDAKPCTVAGSIVSWAGEGICSWIGNADRIDKTDADYQAHVITATVVETGIKIAEKAAINWAVTSVAATVCTVSGPVGWAVAAGAAIATVAVDALLDVGARKVTGDADIKWTQAVGDGIYEVGKAVVKKGEEVAKWAGNTVQNVGKAVSNAWGSFCRWVKG